MYELRTAVDFGTPLVPLRMEGATWGAGKAAFPDITDATYIPEAVDVDGASFSVRPVLRELFRLKAVEHTREYFDAFVEKLVAHPPGGLRAARTGLTSPLTIDIDH